MPLFSWKEKKAFFFYLLWFWMDGKTTLQRHMQRCEVCSSGKTCYHALQVISISFWSKLHKWSIEQPLFPIVDLELWNFEDGFPNNLMQLWFPIIILHSKEPTESLLIVYGMSHFLVVYLSIKRWHVNGPRWCFRAE